MSWTYVAIAGAGIAGSLIGANASKSAANTQVGASKEAIAEQRRQFDINQRNFAPFLEEGQQSVRRLSDLMGVSGNTGATGYGDLSRKFTSADLNADPVYQSGLKFGLDQGTSAINARNIASGTGFDSGATLKQLARYAEDYGTTKANESYNRFTNDQNNLYSKLSGQASTGQTAASNVGQLGLGSTNAITNAMMGGANAQAAGIVGGANAWAGGVNNLSNTMLLKQLLSKNQGGSTAPADVTWMEQGQP
jgi:hypothetical protein